MTEEEKNFYATIGNNIKRVREKAHLKQESLSELLGLSRASIVNIEKGRQCPSLYLIIKLTESLSINIEEVLGEVYIKKNNRKVNSSDSVDEKISQANLDELKDLPDSVIKLRNFIRESMSR